MPGFHSSKESLLSTYRRLFDFLDFLIF
jgi:hypothetical protein